MAVWKLKQDFHVRLEAEFFFLQSIVVFALKDLCQLEYTHIIEDLLFLLKNQFDSRCYSQAPNTSQNHLDKCLTKELGTIT